MPGETARKRFVLALVKPSHYDDDGYVIQWLRSVIPSNSLATLYGLARDCADPDLDRAKAMGVSLFAGEVEGRLEEVLRDACAGTLKPIYNHMNDLPGIEGVPVPWLPAPVVRRTAK